MRHLDLFSGIGGFALAAEDAFGVVEHIFCDNDPFSQAILKKHWPNAPIHGDIKELSGIGKVDLITGGFPCQPFSSAGQRRGTEDDRHLWPEMLRLIRECRPTYVLGENVSGLLTWDGGLVLDQVITDLEGEGYEVGAFIIPAAGVGAPHKRDRVWIAAHSDGRADRGGSRKHARKVRAEGVSQRDEVGKPRKPGAVRHGANTDGERFEGRRTRSCAEGKGGHEAVTGGGHATDASSGRRQQGHTLARGAREGAQRPEERSRLADGSRAWRREWPAVAARLCALDDGISSRMVRPRGWRNAALKAAGNAIVPQVAAKIMKAMQ